MGDIIKPDSFFADPPCDTEYEPQREALEAHMEPKRKKRIRKLNQSVGPVSEATASRVWAAEYRDRDTIKRRAFLEDDFVSDAWAWWPAIKWVTYAIAAAAVIALVAGWVDGGYRP